MRAITGRGNKTTERRLKGVLARAGLSGWRLQPTAVPFRPDLWFPAAGMAVFVDGCFWHGCAVCGHVPKTNIAYWTAKIARNRRRDARARRGEAPGTGI